MSGGRLPNLVIAGVGGAGTTSLFTYLGQHPEVCPSIRKELRYFSPLKYGQELGSLEKYERHFTHCTGETYAMEASPGYFYGGQRLITALEETLPRPRVVVSLRDPVERLWSHYNYLRSKMKLDKDLPLEEYLETAEKLRREGRDRLPENRPYWGLSGGLYSEFIEDWFEALGSRFRVVFFEDLASDPGTVLAQLCEWLEIDPSLASQFNYSVENRTVQYRNPWLQRIALTLNYAGEPFFRRHPQLKRHLRTTYYRFNRDPRSASLDMATRRKLKTLYAASNSALAAELSRRGYHDLPPWLRESAPESASFR
jgi:hypothetical protein